MIGLMGKAVVGTCDFEGCEVVGGMVEQVQVIISGVEWVADLCPEHIQPLRDAMKGAIKKSRRGTRDRVWTMEEIEAMKRGQT